MNSPAQALQELLLVLARELVSEPEALSVAVEEQGRTVRLELSTSQSSDMGKILGRGGKRAQAIRAIVKAKAAHLNRRVWVNFAG